MNCFSMQFSVAYTSWKRFWRSVSRFNLQCLGSYLLERRTKCNLAQRGPFCEVVLEGADMGVIGGHGLLRYFPLGNSPLRLDPFLATTTLERRGLLILAGLSLPSRRSS